LIQSQARGNPRAPVRRLRRRHRDGVVADSRAQAQAPPAAAVGDDRCGGVRLDLV